MFVYSRTSDGTDGVDELVAADRDARPGAARPYRAADRRRERHSAARHPLAAASRPRAAHLAQSATLRKLILYI